jgi:hypothetical protein
MHCLLDSLDQIERAQQNLGLDDCCIGIRECGQPDSAQTTVSLGHAIMNDARHDSCASTLGFSFYQRAKVREWRRYRHSRRLIVVGVDLVRSVGRQQTLDESRRAARRIVVEVQRVDGIDRPPGQNQTQRLTDQLAASPYHSCHDKRARRKALAEGL